MGLEAEFRTKENRVGRKLVRSANLTLSYSLLRADQLLRPTCTRCRTPLDMHQPIPTRPHQLLGTCSDCHSWYRLEVRPGEPHAVMVALPEIAILIPSPAGDAAAIPAG